MLIGIDMFPITIGFGISELLVIGSLRMYILISSKTELFLILKMFSY